MIYNFLIGQHIFRLKTDFEIPWYPWQKNFLKSSDEISGCFVAEYDVKCFKRDPDVSRWPLLYKEESQAVYQGPEGEIRVHHLLGEEVSVFCEERKEGYILWINEILKSQDYMYPVAMMLDKVLLEEAKALLLHSAYIQVGEEAILFSGPSGIGKSTQADLWVNHGGARLINGDRSVLQNRQGRWMACGFPICGTSGTALDEAYPVKALVFPAWDQTNHVRRIQGKEALHHFLAQVSINYWNPLRAAEGLDLVNQILQEIPVYLLSCNMEPEAVEVLKKEIF